MSDIPIFTGNTLGRVITRVNEEWAKAGLLGLSGAAIMQVLNRVIYVDRLQQDGGFESADGVYDLMTMGGGHTFVSDTAIRSWGELGKLRMGPLRANRCDGPSVMLSTRPTVQQDRMISNAIQGAYADYAATLLLSIVADFLNAGGVGSGDNSGMKCYDGKALLADDHVHNPLVKAGEQITIDNKITSDITASTWATILDRVGQWVDIDGKTPAAAMMGRPILMIPTWAAWKKCADIFGVPNSAMPTQGFATTAWTNAADMIYNPWLYTRASDKAAAANKVYLFTGVGRKPIIFREESAPKIYAVGRTDWPAHERGAVCSYVEGWCAIGPGEYRGILEISLS